MHTISGEAIVIFQMLGGVPYTDSAGTANVIQDNEASNNKRWAYWKSSKAQVCPWNAFTQCDAYLPYLRCALSRME